MSKKALLSGCGSTNKKTKIKFKVEFPRNIVPTETFSVSAV